MKVLEQEDAVFVISHKQIAAANGKQVFFIPQATFDKVERFIDLFKEPIVTMLHHEIRPGCIEYWEDNHHDKIVGFLYSLMRSEGHSARDISTSLSALGM